MDQTRLVKISKFLSKYLRHEPERLGLTLLPGGWVPIDVLLAASAARSFPISRAELDEVVATNDKQRFGFDPSGDLIRAHQGHSVPVDLQLDPAIPPPTLYHGTIARSLDSIMREGLRPMRRQHVHLSPDIATARRVGARRGDPIVLVIDAAGLHAAGTTFYRSTNGVWLVDQVPPAYLRRWRRSLTPES